MMYCVVPRDLSRKLRGTLERHFRDDETITVIVDQRTAERRGASDRRSMPLSVWGAAEPAHDDRRRIRNGAGRRVDDRRAVMVAALDPKPLPRQARRHEQVLQFAIRLEPPERRVRDSAAARLAVRAQTGDQDAFRELYLGYFDDVYAYLRLALQSVHDVEDGLQAVFTRALGSLATHEVDSMPFSVWLGTLLYGHAPDRDEVTRVLDDGAAAPSPADSIRLLEWLTDDDLRMLMERLPATEREVMGLCYVLDLTAREIATITGLTVEDIECAHARSVRFMERCVLSLGRRPGYSGRHPITAPPRPEIVMRRRRLALTRG